MMRAAAVLFCFTFSEAYAQETCSRTCTKKLDEVEFIDPFVSADDDYYLLMDPVDIAFSPETGKCTVMTSSDVDLLGISTFDQDGQVFKKIVLEKDDGVVALLTADEAVAFAISVCERDTEQQ